MNKLDAARFSEVISIINTTCDHGHSVYEIEASGGSEVQSGIWWSVVTGQCVHVNARSIDEKKKERKFCLCFWLMIIYNMTSMNQDKYFRGFDICMYLFLFFSLIEIVIYIRCTSIKLLASNHLNVMYHGRDKLLWRTVSSQILDRWFPVLLWTILIRTIDRWR